MANEVNLVYFQLYFPDCLDWISSSFMGLRGCETVLLTLIGGASISLFVVPSQVKLGFCCPLAASPTESSFRRYTAMKILSWNCHGLGNAPAVRALLDVQRSC